MTTRRADPSSRAYRPFAGGGRPPDVHTGRVWRRGRVGLARRTWDGPRETVNPVEHITLDHSRTGLVLHKGQRSIYEIYSKLR